MSLKRVEKLNSKKREGTMLFKNLFRIILFLTLALVALTVVDSFFNPVEIRTEPVLISPPVSTVVTNSIPKTSDKIIPQKIVKQPKLFVTDTEIVFKDDPTVTARVLSDEESDAFLREKVAESFWKIYDPKTLPETLAPIKEEIIHALRRDLYTPSPSNLLCTVLILGEEYGHMYKEWFLARSAMDAQPMEELDLSFADGDQVRLLSRQIEGNQVEIEMGSNNIARFYFK